MFGIYVHIPFCVHKCSYCDFYSFTKHGASDFERFTDVLVREIAEAALWLSRREETLPAVSTIFFGGGTPSLLPLPLLHRIAQALIGAFKIDPCAEFTLEANPETLNPALVEGLAALPGLNRLSLGAQSFNPNSLKILERLGSADSIQRAASWLRQSPLSNFNLDLIFGIPGQSWKDVCFDIESAAALGPNHISFYNLTLKPGHSFYSRLPQDDFSAELYERGVERLAQLGYARYEISNFAKPGYESQHNRLYWDGGEFLGLGPSAASRFFWHGTFHHRKQAADFKKYLSEAAFTGQDFEATSPEQTILEATFLEMRKREGVRLPEFQARYGYDLTQAKKYPMFMEEGYLEREGECLRLSSKGMLLADLVTRELAP